MSQSSPSEIASSEVIPWFSEKVDPEDLKRAVESAREDTADTALGTDV